VVEQRVAVFAHADNPPLALYYALFIHPIPCRFTVLWGV
jgi:hypothetical protein